MGFVALVFSVAVLIHYYLWRRLVRATTVPGRTRRVLTWVLIGLGAFVPVTLIGSRTEWGHFLAWPGFFWIALMFYLLVFLVVLEIPRALALLALRRSERRRAAGAVSTADRPGTVPVATAALTATGPAPASTAPAASEGGEDEQADPPSPTEPEVAPEAIGRRLFIARTAAAVAGAGALVTVGAGVRTALGDPVIESVKVTLPRLDPRLSGLRFAVVSDIHLGPLTGIRHSERIVRMINALQADVVAVVGDLVDGTVAELGSLARPLGDLESRYGAYFVTGNHEYYTANGPEEWIEELRELGIRPLRNERVEIAHAGAVLDLAGVNDVTGATVDDGPDFERALGGRDRSRSTVLLAHQPVQAREAAGYGVDLQLSGHTHGGQMVPFNLVVPIQQPVVSGLGEVDGTQVYVTRGAGFWGPPVRVGASPEITLLELRA
ncbi:membrane protein [Planobispora siamensis]|uniref:Membrane protein n=1 Tax=Planobispora siamensis TaxID=936338 RepID=A0A8J3WKX7_9ACTN|nr:membrane protein [Planobispora siamensis]